MTSWAFYWNEEQRILSSFFVLEPNPALIKHYISRTRCRISDKQVIPKPQSQLQWELLLHRTPQCWWPATHPAGGISSGSWTIDPRTERHAGRRATAVLQLAVGDAPGVHKQFHKHFWGVDLLEGFKCFFNNKTVCQWAAQEEYYHCFTPKNRFRTLEERETRGTFMQWL